MVKTIPVPIFTTLFTQATHKLPCDDRLIYCLLSNLHLFVKINSGSTRAIKSSHRRCSIKKTALKPLIHGQINLIKFIESNKFDNVYSKV